MANYTATQLAALRAAVAAGVTEILHEGTRVYYRSLDEMERIIALIEKDLDADALRTPTRILRMSFRKDL